MNSWQTEIEELHAFFQAYFLGTDTSLDRAERALAPEFTIVGPGGTESNRDETIAALRSAHAHASDLKISVSDCQLVTADGVVIVASYIEHHELADGTGDRRRSTVVFERDSDGPNGVRWQRVHETWISPSE